MGVMIVEVPHLRFVCDKCGNVHLEEAHTRSMYGALPTPYGWRIEAFDMMPTLAYCPNCNPEMKKDGVKG